MPSRNNRFGRSSSREDYLKAVYVLTVEAGKDSCRIKDLIAKLNISAPSACEMVKILEREGSVERLPYKGVRLTSKGARTAREVVKKHRILERFLHDVLGIRHGFHSEAHRLEHAASGRFIERFNRLLNYPGECPEGDPIPQLRSIHGQMVRPLTELKEGDRARIAFILGGMNANCRLAEMGLTQGTRIKVERAPSRGAGPMELEVRGSHLAIGHGIALTVFVRGLEKRVVDGRKRNKDGRRRR